MWQNPRYDALLHIVLDRRTLLPVHHLGSKPLIGKSLRPIEQSIARKFEMDKVVRRVSSVPARLVGVVHGSQAAEAGLDLTVAGVEGHAELCVVGREAAQVMVGFVDGVEEVGGDDEDVDVASVFVEAWRTWRGFGVAGADREAVVDGLGPCCYQLYTDC